MIIFISIVLLIFATLITLIGCCIRLSSLISEMEEKYERDFRTNKKER